MKTSINDFYDWVPLESLIERTSCSYCGETNFEQVGKIKNSRDISLIRCVNCKLVSTDYFPTENFLHHYYTFKFPQLVQKYNVEEEVLVTFSKTGQVCKAPFIFVAYKCF